MSAVVLGEDLLCDLASREVGHHVALFLWSCERADVDRVARFNHGELARLVGVGDAHRTLGRAAAMGLVAKGSTLERVRLPEGVEVVKA